MGAVGEPEDYDEAPDYGDAADDEIDEFPVWDCEIGYISAAVSEEGTDDTAEAVACEPEGGSEGLFLLSPEHGCEEDESGGDTRFQCAQKEPDGEEAGEIEDCGLKHADCAPDEEHASDESADWVSLKREIPGVCGDEPTDVEGGGYPGVVGPGHVRVGLKTVGVTVV